MKSNIYPQARWSAEERPAAEGRPSSSADADRKVLADRGMAKQREVQSRSTITQTSRPHYTNRPRKPWKMGVDVTMWRSLGDSSPVFAERGQSWFAGHTSLI